MSCEAGAATVTETGSAFAFGADRAAEMATRTPATTTATAAMAPAGRKFVPIIRTPPKLGPADTSRASPWLLLPLVRLPGRAPAPFISHCCPAAGRTAR